jgi:hypothetical protein
MKKITLQLLLVGFTFLAVSFAPTDVKKVFSTTEGKMKIEFPGDYEVSKIDENTTKIESVVVNMSYLCTYTINNESVEDPEVLAQSSLDGFNGVFKGTINSKTVWKIQKHKGLKAEIDVPTLKVKVQYHVVLVENIHYQLVVISGVNEFDQKKADAFSKSFRMLK